MDGARDRFKQNKPSSKSQMPHAFTHMWNLGLQWQQ
jgi:hypothetical protein